MRRLGHLGRAVVCPLGFVVAQTISLTGYQAIAAAAQSQSANPPATLCR